VPDIYLETLDSIQKKRYAKRIFCRRDDHEQREAKIAAWKRIGAINSTRLLSMNTIVESILSLESVESRRKREKEQINRSISLESTVMYCVKPKQRSHAGKDSGTSGCSESHTVLPQ